MSKMQRITKTIKYVTLSAFLLAILSQPACAWWNPQWTARKQITITNVGSTTLTDFPAYIRVSKEADMQSDYDDLRFIAGGCELGAVQLSHELGDTNSTSADVYVKIPSLPATGASVCMYYGNSAAASGENPQGVWDDNHRMVTHLSGATDAVHDDSTQYGKDGAKHGGGILSNGGAETGTTTGWNHWDGIESSDVYDGNNAFYEDGAYTILTSGYIPIDLDVEYELAGWFKSYGTGGISPLYFGYIPFDSQYRAITHRHVGIYVNTETYLIEDISASDKIIKVADGTGWQTYTYACIAFEIDDSGSYNDLPNYKLSNFNIIRVEDVGDYWEVEFDTTVGVAYPAGTKIREHHAGGTYMYTAAGNAQVPTTYTKYSSKTKGENLYGTGGGKWRRGTKYAQVMMLINYGKDTTFGTRVDNVSLHPVPGTDGIVGDSVEFNGLDDRIDFGQVLPTDKSQPITLSAWVKADDTGTWRTIIGTQSSSAQIAINPSNQAVFGQNGGGGWWINGGAITPGQWHHITGTYDGANARIYVDGNLMAGPTAQVFDNNHGVSLVGAFTTAGSEPFDGKIDEARISDVARSGDWIKQSMELVSAQDTNVQTQSEVTGLADGWIEYTVDPVSRRHTLSETGRSLTFNVQAGMIPHVYETGDARLDLMFVNKPPFVIDTWGLFKYEDVKGEISWAALTLNLSSVNATIKFDSTVDFTNTDVFNLDRGLNLTFNYIQVNATTQTILQRKATVTLRNLSFRAVKIMKDRDECPDCRVLSYRDGIAVFTVQSGLVGHHAVELAGWIHWNLIDLTQFWVGSVSNNRGVILIGEETEDKTLRQYYSASGSNATLHPKFEVNYTIPNVRMYSNQTYYNHFDLDDYFYDVDGDPLTFATSADHPNVQITIGGDHTVDIAPINNFYGTQYVVFTAFDGKGGEVDSNNVTLEVLVGVTTTTTNQPPVVAVALPVLEVIQVDLLPGDWVNVTVNATVSDSHGCNQIEDVKGVIWANDIPPAGHNQPENNYTVITNMTCAIECSGIDGVIDCNFMIPYFTRSSANWHANISAYDGQEWGWGSRTDLIWIKELVAMDAPTLIDFTAAAGGPLGFNDISPNVALLVENLGNQILDVRVSGQPLTCTTGGSIPVGNVRYHRDNVPYASQFSLTTQSGDTNSVLSSEFDLSMSSATSTWLPTQKSIYWGIQIPSEGVGGTCQGDVTIDGLQSQ